MRFVWAVYRYNLHVPGGEMTVEGITYRDFDTRPFKTRLEEPGTTTRSLNLVRAISVAPIPPMQ